MVSNRKVRIGWEREGIVTHLSPMVGNEFTLQNENKRAVDQLK